MLGRYIEGQVHSMTLKQNRVRPITSLFEIGFYNYFTEMITILRRYVTHKSVVRSHWVEKLGRNIEDKGHSMTLQ
jgi:hypothetical protein